MYDFTALGELLIDYTQIPSSSGHGCLFEQNAGGAPANAACVLAMHRKKSAFIGKVGADAQGDFLIRTLVEKGVTVSGIIRDPDVFTTLAFVSLGENGERTFSFARKPGADTCLRFEEIDNTLLQTKILHVGSLSLTDEPSRTATLRAIDYAKDAGALVSYDPNYRPLLWKDEQTACKAMRSLLPKADLIKLSEEEAPLLTGEHDPLRALDRLEEAGARLIALTRGEKGALLRVKGKTAEVSGFSVCAVDTTGAGDIFWGAFLSAFLSGSSSLDAVTAEEAAGFAGYANAAAALSVQKRGGIPSIPTPQEIAAFLKEQESREA